MTEPSNALTMAYQGSSFHEIFITIKLADTGEMCIVRKDTLAAASDEFRDFVKDGEEHSKQLQERAKQAEVVEQSTSASTTTSTDDDNDDDGLVSIDEDILCNDAIDTKAFKNFLACIECAYYKPRYQWDEQSGTYTDRTTAELPEDWTAEAAYDHVLKVVDLMIGFGTTQFLPAAYADLKHICTYYLDERHATLMAAEGGEGMAQFHLQDFALRMHNLGLKNMGASRYYQEPMFEVFLLMMQKLRRFGCINDSLVLIAAGNSDMAQWMIEAFLEETVGRQSV